MAKKIVPTFRFDAYSDITVRFLKENGIRGILTDLDSTLTEHNFPEPDERLQKWIAELREADIPVCIVSNNKTARTLPFAEKTGTACVCRALKPNKRGILRALSIINRTAAETLFIGDQLYTDIKGAENAGMRSALVKPVGNRTTVFIRLKRLLERRHNDN